MANTSNFSESSGAGKYILWLLVIAAVLIIVILLTLLTSDDKKTSTEEVRIVTSAVQEITPEISVSPQMLNWSDTEIGETQKQKFVVTANSPVIISDVKLLETSDIGLSEPKTDCINMGQINRDLPCTITLEFTPLGPVDIQGVPMSIEWRGANQPEKLISTKTIAMSVGAREYEQPVVTPEYMPEPIVIPDFSEDVESITEIEIKTERFEPMPEIEPDFKMSPVALPESKIANEIIDIGANNIFANQPALAPMAMPVAEPEIVDTCDKFSFYGYNSYGAEIGWVKPVAGAYKFYPFSDTTCTNATGRYNPDNGIISDIKDPSIQIGTDAANIGLTTIRNGVMPQLSNPVAARNTNRAVQLDTAALTPSAGSGRLDGLIFKEDNVSMLPSSFGSQSTVNSIPYDRTFVLRQYKPIPATIVTEIRAVANETRLPVTATVDRNVYSDDGRTIIVPTGTMMLGSVVGDMPGPYKSVGRVNIEWYRFVRPDGVEFNFAGQRPFSGDAQGRTGVLGRGSTDYVEQMVMPMLTAVVPAAVNLIAPISDSFINQIDLDSNTVTQSGQIRSSELAKNEIITAWNQVAQKILTDMIDDSVPPFTIGAGTRITVFSPTDLILTCGSGTGKKCSITEYNNSYAATEPRNITIGVTEPETLVGQVRSFTAIDQFCDDNGDVKAGSATAIAEAGLDYRTVLFYCESQQYEAINNAQQEAIYQNQQQTGIIGSSGNTLIKGTQEYNEEVLGLEYGSDGTILNPFESAPAAPATPTITCPDGTNPDANGCCTGEIYTDMGDQGFNCCPSGGGDCFPPIL